MNAIRHVWRRPILSVSSSDWIFCERRSSLQSSQRASGSFVEQTISWTRVSRGARTREGEVSRQQQIRGVCEMFRERQRSQRLCNRQAPHFQANRSHSPDCLHLADGGRWRLSGEIVGGSGECQPADLVGWRVGSLATRAARSQRVQVHNQHHQCCSRLGDSRVG